jgi:hypothetical protein
MSTTVHLATNDPAKRLSLSNIRLAGAYDYLVAELQVLSWRFSCEHEFYFDRFHADNLLRALEGMDGGIIAEAVLKQEWDDDCIRFENQRLGAVIVAGEVAVHGPDHRFAFTIETDQTVLRPFINDFRSALATAL